MAHMEVREGTELVKGYYMDYARYVLETRALPSIYDGLKLAQRRLVHVASKSGTGFSKSSKILGDTIPYHPHGLDSLYGVLVNMTTGMNPYRLFDGKGNWGGVGFGAAAYRYTEARLGELARYLYANFSDYAEYVEGESGFEEPRALPALIPYSLLVGSTGIGVGLSTNVMPLDLMELIDYYISVIRGEEPRTPTPDLGNYVLDMSDEEIDKAVEGSEGKLRIRSVITMESDTVLVLDGSYGKDVGKVVKGMSDLIDAGVVDFRDETTTRPRYVFEIVDASRVTVGELRERLEGQTAFSKTFKRLVADGEVGVYAPLRYQVEKSLGYLNECLDRMFEDKMRRLEFSRQVLLAIRSMRVSGLLRDIPNITANQLKRRLKDEGFDGRVVDAAVSRNMTYLTRSHDDELRDVKREMGTLGSIDRTEFLVGLYEELRNVARPAYEAASHTVRRSRLLKSPRFTVVDGGVRVSDRGTPFDSTVYAVHPDGSMTAHRIGVMVARCVPLDEDDVVKVVPDTRSHVVFITNRDRFLAADLGRAANRAMVKLADGERVVDARVVDEVDGTIPFRYGGRRYDAMAVYRRRASSPRPLGRPMG